jgi:hypothetical protein
VSSSILPELKIRDERPTLIVVEDVISEEG